jgi:hypothetical protein
LFTFHGVTHSDHFMYLELLMVDGYRQTDWPMQ